MKAAGIIAEYNPFHNGHKFQLDQVRKITGADYIIVAMSGDFVQRGEPAILDKHSRARMALANGADLVLELPVTAATASAEGFAASGVNLLASTGIVDSIWYGVEEENADLLHILAKHICHPTPDFTSIVIEQTKRGASYAAAREQAILAGFPSYMQDEIAGFLHTPNNILALEYEKAILLWNETHARRITGHGIKREGSGYHDLTLDIDSAFASATAIRACLLQTKCTIIVTDSKDTTYEISAAPDSSLDPIRTIPEESLRLLSLATVEHRLLCADDFSEALYMRLLEDAPHGFDHYKDCSKALSNRIISLLPQYTGFSQFAELLKTKELTRTRINRVLIHILLHITNTSTLSSAQLHHESSSPDLGRNYPYRNDLYSVARYFRVLGFRREAASLFSEIRKGSDLPLITKIADAMDILDEDAKAGLAHDIYAADLYRGIAAIKSGRALPNEYTTELVIR